MPGGPPGGAMPPGMMMPGANGAPFDMSKIKEMLEDPSIKDMAKQIAEDPAFKAMAENMQASMAAGGALPGMPPGAGGGVPGMPPGVDPKQAMEAMQNVMQNPAFMQMAEKLGTQMMQDPQMASMMQQMQDPATTEKMKAKMEALKEDPEMAEIMKEIETGGPSAMMKYWNDPKVLQKISGAMGDIMPGMPMGDMGAAAAEEEFGSATEEPPREEQEAFISDVVAPNFEEQLADIQELTPPEEDQEEIDALLAALEDLVAAANDDPGAVIDGEITEASELAQEYGFQSCGS